MKNRHHKQLATAALIGAMGAGLLACGGGGGGGGAGGALTTATSPGASGTNTSASEQSLVNTAPVAATAAPKLADCELFPQEAIFNTRIDDAARFPAHAKSGQWIASVGPSTPFRADWGRSEDQTQRDAYFGVPINVVDGTSATTNWARVLYDFTSSGVSSAVGWPHESDCAVGNASGGFDLVRGCSRTPVDQRRFPVPTQDLKAAGGTCTDPNTCGDHHMVVVEAGACRLWEGYSFYPLGGQWYALTTAAWDLKSLAMRPNGWTAADAAGLPMTPFLVKAAEAAQGEIRHALRVTFRDSALAREFVWPARHGAGGDTPGAIPFGALLRLRADFVIPDNWTPQAKAIATAAKRYGMYVADIGMDFYVQGEPSVTWEAATFRQLGGIALSNMEFVDLGAVTGDARFSADSMAAQWR